jgi:hypothetical protein
MAYRLTKNNYRSFTTNRDYQFTPGDAIDQRRARAAMEHDDATFKQAEQTRIANRPPDPRSRADIVRDETVHKSQPSGSAGKGMGNRLAELQEQLSRAVLTPERNRIQRRIDALTPRAEQHQTAVTEAAEHKAKLDAPEVQAAITEGQALYDSFAYRPDVAESIVQGAASALEALKQNLDVAAFKATAAELRGQHNQARQATMAQLRANIKTLESELLVVKVDAAPSEAVQIGPLSPVSAE